MSDEIRPDEIGLDDIGPDDIPRRRVGPRVGIVMGSDSDWPVMSAAMPKAYGIVMATNPM
jgi:hypothetical protein